MHIGRSLLVSEVFFSLKEDEAAQLQAIDKLMNMGYEALEVGAFSSSDNRKALNALASKHDCRIVYWTIPTMTAEALSLSTLDEGLRLRTVERLKTLIGEAAEAGATLVGIPSGADPGKAARTQATENLLTSLLALKDHLSNYPQIRLLIEPLDREVHKRQLIGPMEETVSLVRRAREGGIPLYICYDSAHEALGEADIVRSFELAAPYMAQFHLCNAVLDKSSLLYGDYHLPVGLAPRFETTGYLTVDAGARVLRKALELFKDSDVQLTCAIEIRSTGENGAPIDGFKTEVIARNYYDQALACAQEG